MMNNEGRKALEAEMMNCGKSSCKANESVKGKNSRTSPGSSRNEMITSLSSNLMRNESLKNDMIFWDKTRRKDMPVLDKIKTDETLPLVVNLDNSVLSALAKTIFQSICSGSTLDGCTVAATSGIRNSSVSFEEEFKSIQSGVDEIRINMRLIFRMAEECGMDVEHDMLLLDDTPEQKTLEKMLERPFIPMFARDGSLSMQGDCMNLSVAPDRPVLYREILLPNINLGSISDASKSLLKTLSFNVFTYKEINDEKRLYLFIMTMFYELDLMQKFQISDVTLYRFLVIVSRKYRLVPFHNFYHAFNVTQTMYYFIKTCGIQNILNDLQILSLMVSALVHDCDHPGLSNDFLHNAQTRIYHMHKKSALENHHYLNCMAVLANPETNILRSLSRDEESKVGLYLRDLILSTDLAIHGIILNNLTLRKKFIAKHVKANTVNLLLEEDQRLLMFCLIKCADISNEIRPDFISKRWASLVYSEFLEQSNKEKILNLPVTPFMDRDKIIIAKEQSNFIKLCLPLYEQLAFVLPELESCCVTMEMHQKRWQEHLKRFFTRDPNGIKKLSNKSIWERKEPKTKGFTLSSMLEMRATHQVKKSFVRT